MADIFKINHALIDENMSEGVAHLWIWPPRINEVSPREVFHEHPRESGVVLWKIVPELLGQRPEAEETRVWRGG